MVSAQLPTTDNSSYNNPLALPAQQNFSANETVDNQNQFSGHEDESELNTLGSHVVLLTTCLRELKSNFSIANKLS